jgi:hypothetical protein
MNCTSARWKNREHCWTIALLNGNKRWSLLNTVNGRGRVSESVSDMIHKSGRMSFNLRKLGGIRDKLEGAYEAEERVVDWDKDAGGLNHDGPQLCRKSIFRRM